MDDQWLVPMHGVYCAALAWWESDSVVAVTSWRWWTSTTWCVRPCLIRSTADGTASPRPLTSRCWCWSTAKRTPTCACGCHAVTRPIQVTGTTTALSVWRRRSSTAMDSWKVSEREKCCTVWAVVHGPALCWLGYYLGIYSASLVTRQSWICDVARSAVVVTVYFVALYVTWQHFVQVSLIICMSC